ncbi:MAG TPA: adenylate/guanylate cyclase domain-containing protein [Thermoplasmata archaeon]|nr:adenylate/guanylate cyclase domain-containing protein [Thermoplasmata archaeon]
MSRRLAAIMFTDVAGYTQLAQTDEAGALRLLEEQERVARPLLATHRGRKVKSMGDGLLLEFPNALDAVEFGVGFQRALHERNARTGALPLRLRVGIHLGDVQAKGADILGDAVNVASRVEPLADPGGVALSVQVYDQVHRKANCTFERLGPRKLEGVVEPIEIYRVAFPWSPPANVVLPSVVPRVAVLPLANISPDPHDEYFADGLTEELISVLSRIGGLRVLARTSVNQYKGTSKPISVIGAELGAQAVLEGSVRKDGDQLRITMQLIDADTQEHRWAQTYDRRLENVFAIQAEVAERTAEALKVQLLSSERKAIEEQPTANFRAYELYLRGVRAAQTALGGMASAEGARADRAAEEYFEAAIREDPAFSAAYSHLANHLIAASGETRPARLALARARVLTLHALELHPSSSDAHTAQGNLAMQADHDWPRAEAEFQQAIALNSSSSAAHVWYGHLLTVLQRYREADKQFAAAIELDPLWFYPQFLRAWNQAYAADYERFLALSEKLLADFGDRQWSRGTLAWAYAFAGRVQEAVRLLKPLVTPFGLPLRHIQGELNAFLGRPQQLRSWLATLERNTSASGPSPVLVASAYGMCGEREKALGLLERDCATGEGFLWNHYQWVGFDRVRDDPRFAALVRAMGLPPGLTRPLWDGRGPFPAAVSGGECPTTPRQGGRAMRPSRRAAPRRFRTPRQARKRPR